MAVKSSCVWEIAFFFVLLLISFIELSWASENERLETYTITGKIQIRNAQDSSWLSDTRVVADGGKYTGYVRKDGSFSINGVPSGTYVVEVYSSNYEFSSIRVDINKNGKIRARKVNFLKMSTVEKLPYPLTFTTGGQAPFFMKREGWSVIDMVTKNPMILYLVLPLLLLFILPKLIGGLDPESQKVKCVVCLCTYVNSCICRCLYAL
jgi:hypothetical protein